MLKNIPFYLKSDSYFPKKLILFVSNHLKMMKNAFYFMLKAFSFLRYLIFFPDFFGHVEKRVDKNVKLSFKIYTSHIGKQIFTKIKV